MTNLPERPPFILVLLALLSLALGVLITPELLIELGPFRISLTSDNPLTSRTARIEIAVLRGLCIFAGVFLLALTIWWHRFVETTLIKIIAEHPGSRHRDSARSPIRNRSLYVTLVAWLTGMAYVGVGGFVLPKTVTAAIGANEGLLEQATAVLFLICSVIFGLAAWYYRGDRQTRLFLAIFAFIFLVFVGEETSWGQWIWGFETLDMFKGVNVQDENNLHNLLGYAADHIFIAGVFFYGVVLPVLRAYHPFWDSLFAMIGLPIASLGLALGFLPISLTHSWTVEVFFDPTVGLRMAELREFLTAIAFLMLACESWTMTSRSRAKTPVRDTSLGPMV